jgi:hypothetical protein
MIRHLYAILKYLVAGAAASIAIAVAISLGVNIDSDRSWPVELYRWPESVGGDIVWDTYWTAPGSRVLVRQVGPAEPGNHPGRAISIDSQFEQLLPGWLQRIRRAVEAERVRRTTVIDGRGWPLVSMYGMAYQDHSSNWKGSGAVVISTAQDAVAPKLIPLTPVWVGLVPNAFIYGGALWLARRSIRATRQQLRVYRGQCRHCGFQVAPGTVRRCPECGATDRDAP